jgi:hypothetical protein
MRAHRKTCILVVVVLAGSLALAQGHPGTNSAAAPSPGIQINVLLKTDLSTKYSKVGDPVELDIGHALNTFQGHDPQTLMGEHTLLVGTVTMVQKAGNGQPGAVGVRITEAPLKDGTHSPINVTLAEPVRIIHNIAAFANDRHLPGTVTPNGTDISSVDDISVSPDPKFGGGVISSKHNFFLMKNQTELAVVLH